MTTHSAELRPHPTTPCDAIHRFSAALEKEIPGRLRVRFSIEGDIDRLRLPMPEPARRCDGLWQHSCFEAFLRPDGRNPYYEFNFAPSGHWAAYRFGGRRADRSSPDLSPPVVSLERHRARAELTADISLGSFSELAAATATHAGLSAVIETDQGHLSYWALAHGGDRPDFHDPASFLLRVTIA